MSELSDRLYAEVAGSELAQTISRYVQLTRNGLELRGICPFCRDNRFIVGNMGRNRTAWACMACGAQDRSGGDLGAFKAIVDADGIRPVSDTPLPPIVASSRWVRVLPPEGSYPVFSKYFANPESVTPEYDDQGRVCSYIVKHPGVSPLRWMYVRFVGVSWGRWKPRPLPWRERLRDKSLSLKDILAERVRGLDIVAVRDLIEYSNSLELKGDKGKAVAIAMRELGWERHRKSWGVCYRRPKPKIIPFSVCGRYLDPLLPF